MTHPQLKLTYFDGPGSAELTRLMFHYGGVPFTDERISFEAFAELKPSLPLGQVPVLEVDGTVFSQSMAIARYAAKIAGVYPTDPVEALRVDMVSETFADIGLAIYDFQRETDEAAIAEKTKKFHEEVLPRKLQALEDMALAGFFLGENVSLADFQLFDVVTNCLGFLDAAFSLDAFPKLSAVVANVEALPAIAAFTAK